MPDAEAVRLYIQAEGSTTAVIDGCVGSREMVEGDQAARALTEALEHFVAALPDGWASREAGAVAVVTMAPAPTLNGVWVDGGDASPECVASTLDRVAATSVPYCLQIRPGCGPPLSELAARRGMTGAEELPLMVLEDASLIEDDVPEELSIRVLAPDDARHHATVAAAGFEVPEELFLRLITPDVLRADGVRCYLGEVDGEPVTTGIGAHLGESVGVFNIATAPAHRRHGYGAAVTARAVRDAASADARWAWLQSSPAGYPVYERLGFRTVESWQCWVSPDT